MGKLENIQDRLNQYLRKKNLPKIEKQATDITMLFELTLRSVWTLENKEQRESIAVEIAQALKPYFGGKKIEDALDDITAKLEKERVEAEIEAKEDAEEEKLKNLKERIKDPNYVPTFEELMKIKKEKEED
ncbi:MAG: hypothetical protein JXJ04_23270 [Spirochaetales bacterium]|nr:hypothetical protein [Spirochaetales bacterium]